MWAVASARHEGIRSTFKIRCGQQQSAGMARAGWGDTCSVKWWVLSAALLQGWGHARREQRGMGGERVGAWRSRACAAQWGGQGLAPSGAEQGGERDRYRRGPRFDRPEGGSFVEAAERPSARSGIGRCGARVAAGARAAARARGAAGRRGGLARASHAGGGGGRAAVGPQAPAQVLQAAHLQVHGLAVGRWGGWGVGWGGVGWGGASELVGGSCAGTRPAKLSSADCCQPPTAPLLRAVLPDLAHPPCTRARVRPAHGSACGSAGAQTGGRR